MNKARRSMTEGVRTALIDFTIMNRVLYESI